MAVRKNPDWSIWLADVWHWARQPPGIYICVIVILAAALWYSQSTPTYKLASSPPPAAPAAPTYPPHPVIPPATPVPTPDNLCPNGQRYAPYAKHCVYFTPGTQNNCAADYIYINSLDGCIPLTSDPHYRVWPGNYFRLTGNRTPHITLLEGAATLTEDQTSQFHSLTPGIEYLVQGPATFRASAFTRIIIRFQ